MLPAELSRLGDLELIARAIVEGAVTGGHRSPFHGYSAEFSQYRAYRPGDDLKYVDWKLFARTDRVYTKQFRETTNTAAVIAVDRTASMAFGGDVTKGRYAQMLAAALAFIITRQGDAVGMLAFGEGAPLIVPPRAGMLQRTRVLAALHRLSFAGTCDLAAAIRRAHELLPARGLLIVISDWYDADERVTRALRRAVNGGHDVSVFHVVAPGERHPVFDGGELQDLETGQTTPVTPGMVDTYRHEFEAFLSKTRAQLVRHGIDYVLAPTDQPVTAVLRRYLFRRAA